ncbi:hypothetical protein QN358_11480, partial [Subtercola sp. RTI3]|nr:hypothetical protein [Subtercola sp. RTI3]
IPHSQKQNNRTGGRGAGAGVAAPPDSGSRATFCLEGLRIPLSQGSSVGPLGGVLVDRSSRNGNGDGKKRSECHRDDRHESAGHGTMTVGCRPLSQNSRSRYEGWRALSRLRTRLMRDHDRSSSEMRCRVVVFWHLALLGLGASFGDCFVCAFLAPGGLGSSQFAAG